METLSLVKPAQSLFSRPGSVAELGIREALVTELFLKHVYMASTSRIESLSRSLKLPVELVESVFHRLKSQQLLEVKGMYGDDFTITLSQAGKNATLERMQVSRYAGPVPVPLETYEAVVRAQKAHADVNAETLKKAYGDLELDPELLTRLGPALASGTSMFLYGPSGTGKTSLAERILRIFDDFVAIPYAIEVNGGIVGVFDPAVHQIAEEAPYDHDPRWAICRRPCIIVGGELVPSMLELQRDAESGSYAAPLHMKANNGIFVVDDLGRQIISPRDLLNRWIVPLDRGIDFLAMSGGSKFAIPFELFVIFSTNLDPAGLADEAFLRRIHNKILVDAVRPGVFDRIVKRRLDSTGWLCEEGSCDYLRETCLRRGGDLRPCYPRDFFRIIGSIARYEEREPVLRAAEIDRAAELYFGRL